MLNEACPAASTATLYAQVVAPSVKVTDPVGEPLVAVVVDVKVTDCPTVAGFGEPATAVVVLRVAELTTCGVPPSSPLLPSQAEVPVKVAVMVCVPTASVEVEKEAWPAPSTVTLEARTVAPSVKVTVPVGTPPVPATVAVNVTDWPDVDGFGDEVRVVVVAPWAT